MSSRHVIELNLPLPLIINCVSPYTSPSFKRASRRLNQWDDVIHIEISDILYNENRKVDYYKQQCDIGQVTGISSLNILSPGNNN